MPNSQSSVSHSIQACNYVSITNCSSKSNLNYWDHCWSSELKVGPAFSPWVNWTPWPWYDFLPDSTGKNIVKIKTGGKEEKKSFLVQDQGVLSSSLNGRKQIIYKIHEVGATEMNNASVTCLHNGVIWSTLTSQAEQNQNIMVSPPSSKKVLRNSCPLKGHRML